MIDKTVSEWFKKNEWTWNLKRGRVSPSERDIQDALDEAAKMLYTEPDGAQLEVGRLIIKKNPISGYDVYMLVGQYY